MTDSTPATAVLDRMDRALVRIAECLTDPAMTADNVSTAYDLATAVEAAKRPLLDLAEQMGRNRRRE